MPRKANDLTGKVFGRLTALDRAGTAGGAGVGAKWRCLCECGNTCVVKAKDLVSGDTKSCGCLITDANAKREKLNAHSWSYVRPRDRDEHAENPLPRIKFCHSHATGQRPCHVTECFWHMYRDVKQTPEFKAWAQSLLDFDFSIERFAPEMPELCSLRLADESGGGMTSERVAQVLGVGEQEVAELERRAFRFLKQNGMTREQFAELLDVHALGHAEPPSVSFGCDGQRWGEAKSEPLTPLDRASRRIHSRIVRQTRLNRACDRIAKLDETEAEATNDV